MSVYSLSGVVEPRALAPHVSRTSSGAAIRPAPFFDRFGEPSTDEGLIRVVQREIAYRAQATLSVSAETSPWFAHSGGASGAHDQPATARGETA
jgi:hypothetical protein